MKIRLLWFSLLCVASPAFCETFIVTSAPSSAIVYIGGAKVTRKLTLELPAGRHSIVLPDLPPELEYQVPQIAVTNAILGPVSVRKDALPPLVDAETEDIVAARAQLQSAEAALANHMDDEARVMSAAEAATMQIDFLRTLAKNEGLSSDAGNLHEIAVMVGEQTRRARQQILDAEKAVRGMRERREDLEDAVKNADEALAVLLTAEEDRFQAELTLSTETATTAELSVSYFVPANWEPLYDVSLSTAQPAQVSVRRGAAVEQYSGEDWTNVEMSLSTLSVSERLMPYDVFPRKLRAVDPTPTAKPLHSSSRQLQEQFVEAPVVVEEVETAAAIYDGPGVTYDVPAPVTVAKDVDAVRISLDTIAFPAEVFARAVPLADETAYLMARFTNRSDEPIFRSGNTFFSVDNELVGVAEMPEIPAGDEGVLAFGAIEDLRLERQVLDRTDGDTGLISRSNLRAEETRIIVTNLGQKSYALELIGQVPYSEQEDLVITFTADPESAEQRYEGMRGVLKWDLNIQPDQTARILLNQSIRWPEDKVLE
ncbi:hypothetical protein So717_40870 [Roseobacter cerasinus]|uniref:Mucoidy inhibitor MuiA family protein n=1 Tax=Roseobacter cerasinus TaxID=2602289 RepID=A0A640VXK7_9RHOB|nr:DUF4139 domain-containing protein [Roseobacter cerasinus]GFE52334.1 hypothetical protein So717_40870 [Roseobacter cerasinus]